MLALTTALAAVGSFAVLRPAPAAADVFVSVGIAPGEYFQYDDWRYHHDYEYRRWVYEEESRRRWEWEHRHRYWEHDRYSEHDRGRWHDRDYHRHDDDDRD
jgi:hypothetical protein